MHEKYTKYLGAKIHYRVTGYGTPVILLHGFAEDGSIWNKQVSFLQDKYHLIIPDLPGSGESEMIRDEQTGIDTYASCINHILEEENIHQCIMIGHSMGGYITLSFAEQYAGKLMAFGLFHSSAYADSDEKKEARQKSISFILDHGAEPFLETAIPGLFADPVKSNKDMTDLLEKGKKFQPEALVQYYKAMINRPDRTHILRATKLPVCMIMGIYDKAVPFEHSLEQSYMADHSFINIMRYSGHMSMLEETAPANEKLAFFLHNLPVR